MNKIINALTTTVSVIYGEYIEGNIKYFTLLVVAWFAGLILTDVTTSLAWMISYLVSLIVALNILKAVLKNEND